MSTLTRTIKRHRHLEDYLKKQLQNDEDISMLDELLELERELTQTEE